MRILIGLMALAVLSACAPAPVAPARAYDASVTRDEYGVPTAHGHDDADAAYALALAHAEDNFKTIQLVVLASRGRLGAYLGEQGARSDFLWHLLGVKAAVDAGYDAVLSEETRAVVQGFADGLNAYGRAHPQEILPGAHNVSGRDVVAGFTLTSPLFWGFDSVLGRVVDETSHPCAVREASAEALYWGSNAFAVAPSRSDDHHTRLIVNSHQPWAGPVAWYEAGVQSDSGWTMHGGLFPGAPFPLLGTNGALGWAATVNFPDLADIYQLTTDDAHKDQYFYDGTWRRFETRRIWLNVKLGPVTLPVPRTLRFSEHGPAFKSADGWVAVRYAGAGDIRIVEQYYRMTKARTFEDWRAALAMRAIPSTNMVYADATGRIGYFYNAILPRRAEGPDWSGCVPGDRSDLVWAQGDWLDAPEQVSPRSGWLVSTNSAPWVNTDADAAMRPEDFPAASPYIETYVTNRGMRALEMLSPLRSISDAQLLAAKFDVTASEHSRQVAAINTILAADASNDAALAEIQSALRAWDRRSDAANTHAALANLMFFPMYNARRMGQSEPSPLDTARTARDYLMTHFGKLDPAWGEVLRLRRGSADLPLDGAPDTLRALRWTPDADGKLSADFGDGFMMVMDWAPDGSLTTRVIHQWGASEHEGSPHYNDQSALYAREQWRVLGE